MKNTFKISLITTALMVLAACSGKNYPENIKPVENFELNRYLGTWYEMARLDHSFERGLEQVTAHYSMRDDGGIEVTNKGYDVEGLEWSESIGKAYFVGDENTGHLKVSFFGPFYGTYVIFQIDPDYQLAYVAGDDYNYLWLLSRTAEITDQQRHDFIQLVASKGYALDDLIWVNHSQK